MKEFGTQRKKGLGVRSLLAGGITFGLSLLGAQENENPDALLREWKSENGKFSVTAVLESFDVARRQVVLRREDSSLLKVPLNRLSVSDRAFVREQTQVKPTAGPVKLYGIAWQPKVEAALKKAAGGSSPLDDQPVMWFRVLGQLDDGM
jgi:hypothetical protein